MKLLQLGPAVAMAVLTFSCGEVQDHNDFNLLHNCELESSNAAWENLPLDLFHDDQRSCPQNATPGVSVVEAGGIVNFPPADYPHVNPGYQNWPAHLFLDAFNAFQACQTLGTKMSSQQADFVWYDLLGGSPNGNGPDGTPDWAAGAWTSFTAGTGIDPNRDCPTFVVVKGIQSTNAVATMIVNYSH